MDFTKTDFVILLTMTLAIISMSFVFPALGLTNEDPAAENEIPEFNISADRFGFAGDAPEAPRTPTQGSLWFYAGDPGSTSDNVVWLDGDTSDGVEMFLAEESNGTGYVRINTWDSGNVTDSTEQNFSAPTDEFTLVSSEGFGLRFDAVEANADTRYYEVDYRVTERPRDSGGFISSLIGVAGDTAQTLVWLGMIFFWFCMFLVEVGLNALSVIADVMIYLITLVNWLTTTYTGIITASSGFASVFVAIPGILLAGILAKIVFIGVSLLPTT